MLELQVRRGSTWRPVDASVDAALIYGEANALRRQGRGRVAVRVLLDGAQKSYWPATRAR